MRSRVLSSAVLPAIALPAMALGPVSHTPGIPGFGISRAVHIVTATIGSVAPGGSPARHRPAAHHRARAPHASRRFVVIDCSGHGVIRPRSFQLACADGNDLLSRLHWQTWGQNYASAWGMQTMNDCRPSCAQGRFRSYPIRVIFWGNTPVSGHPGEQRYTMITLLYTGHQPAVPNGASSVPGPPSVTGTLWS